MTIQIGCDNSCAFCIVPAVRGVEMSRPFGEVVAEVERSPPTGRHRGDAARPERQQLRPRPAAGGAPGRRRASAAPPAVRRPAARRSAPSTGIRRVRFTSPHPKDMRPETFAAMAEVGRGVRAPPLPAAVGQRPDPRHDAPRLHRRALPRPARRRPPRRSPTSRCRPTSSSASRARPRPTSSARMEVAAAAEYDYAYMFIFSPRAGHRGGDDGRPTSSIRPSSANASSACAIVVERSALAKHEAGSAGSRRSSSRARASANPSVTSGRTRQNKLVHFTPPSPLRTGSYATVEITARRPAPPAWATSSSSLAEPTHRLRIPVAASEAARPTRGDERRAHRSVRWLIGRSPGPVATSDSVAATPRSLGSSVGPGRRGSRF